MDKVFKKHKDEQDRVRNIPQHIGQQDGDSNATPNVKGKITPIVIEKFDKNKK